jgi:hypothetical protein
MVLGDNSLTVQHAHIYVHKWEDEDEEDETGELPEPVLESVPLRCSPAINVSSRSAHATTSDSGIPPQLEASTSSSGYGWSRRKKKEHHLAVCRDPYTPYFSRSYERIVVGTAETVLEVAY